MYIYIYHVLLARRCALHSYIFNARLHIYEYIYIYVSRLAREALDNNSEKSLALVYIQCTPTYKKKTCIYKK